MLYILSLNIALILSGDSVGPFPLLKLLRFGTPDVLLEYVGEIRPGLGFGPSLVFFELFLIKY